MTLKISNDPWLASLQNEWMAVAASRKPDLERLDARITQLYDELKDTFDSADVGTGDGGIRYYVLDVSGTVISIEAPQEFIDQLRPIVEQAKKEAQETIPTKLAEAEAKAIKEGKKFGEKDAAKVAEDVVKKAVEALPVSISDDNKKVMISRDSKNAEFLPINLEKYMRHGSLATSSWARTAVKAYDAAVAAGLGEEAAKVANSADYKTVKALETLGERNSNIAFRVFSQREEAEASGLSNQELWKRKNPNNPLLANVNSGNTKQMEAGKGSTQGQGIIDEQTVEVAGSWVDAELKKRSAVDVKDELKAKFAADLAPVEALKGTENVVMQGLLAVCLSNDKIAKALGVNKEDWIRAQVPVELSAVIAALRANLDGTPSVVTLALLEAFQEKYGSNFRILNMKEEMPLFNEQGALMGYAKITGSHGIASKHFDRVKRELEAAQKKREEVLKEIDYNEGLATYLGKF